MLFGDSQYAQLPDYMVEIIVQNSQGAAEREQIVRLMQAAALHKNQQTFRHTMKRFGFPLAAIATLYGGLKHVNPMRPIRPIGDKPGNLQGTSFFNLPWGADV